MSRPLALVTGATGFVGGAVVRALIDRGRAVRVTTREGSDRANIDGLEVECVQADLRRPADCRAAVKGCAELYHVAAHYALWVEEPRVLYDSNVGGTTHIIEAAAAAGVGRMVYTSTVGAVGIPRDGSPGDETTPLRRKDLVGHYKRSKFLAERAAVRLQAERDLPLVIVNPSAPMGVRDVKPTPTGQIVVDFLNGKMPAYLDTGLNVVDVADVAIGHVLAAERGRPGARYILGNQNLSLREILETLAEISGLPAPRIQIPYPLALASGYFSTLLAIATRQPPAIPLTGVRMARKKMFFTAERAFRELGLPRTPPRTTLARAVRWFAANGHITDPRLAQSLIGRATACLSENGAQ